MIHLTFTGYYAGLPFCQCDKEKAYQKGDTFTHYVYWHDMNHPDLCPECKAIAEDTTEDETQE